VWHVSVSLLCGGLVSNQRMKRREDWTASEVKEGRKLCRKLLREVGGGEEFWKVGEMCEHYRKLMTAEEIQRLDPKWLALPAIDEAG